MKLLDHLRSKSEDILSNSYAAYTASVVSIKERIKKQFVSGSWKLCGSLKAKFPMEELCIELGYLIPLIDKKNTQTD